MASAQWHDINEPDAFFTAQEKEQGASDDDGTGGESVPEQDEEPEVKFVEGGWFEFNKTCTAR